MVGVSGLVAEVSGLVARVSGLVTEVSGLVVGVSGIAAEVRGRADVYTKNNTEELRLTELKVRVGIGRQLS